MADQRPYILESPAGREVIINGRQYLYFAGTSYFELHNHPELVEAAVKATETYGTASATSRAMTGTTPPVRELEKMIASYFGSDSAAYLPSGYLSNLAGISALREMDLFERIFIDKDSHYSLLDGSLSTGKPVIRFEHRDVDDLKRKLEHHLKGNERPLIASDGIFPAQGTLAPLPEFLELARLHKGVVWVDDAHGAGILGKQGRGTIEHFGLDTREVYMGATLSKAFGSYGGTIPGPHELISRIQEGNVMVGSSAPVNAAVAAGIRGMEILMDQPRLRKKLWENARYLKEGLDSLNLPVEKNNLPIAAFQAGNAAEMQRIQQLLMDNGIFIQYSRYRGTGSDGLLRIVVFSTHTHEQIDQLISTLGKHLPGQIVNPG